MASVQEYPQLLHSTAVDPLDPTLSSQRAQTYGYNELSPEYTKGYENKLALYFTDNWQVTPRFNVYYGGRLEYYRMSADQISASRDVYKRQLLYIYRHLHGQRAPVWKLPYRTSASW